MYRVKKLLAGAGGDGHAPYLKKQIFIVKSLSGKRMAAPSKYHD